MCIKVNNANSSNTRIDQCMNSLISNLNTYGIKTYASCCGHGRYPMTIIIKHKNGMFFDICNTIFIPRKRNFYKRDNLGYYYIPETVK